MAAFVLWLGLRSWSEHLKRSRDQGRCEGRKSERDQRQDVEKLGESVKIPASGDVGEQSDAGEAAERGKHQRAEVSTGGNHAVNEHIVGSIASIAAALTEGNRLTTAGSRPMTVYYAATIVGTILVSIPIAYLIWNYELSRRQTTAVEVGLILDHRPVIALGKGRLERTVDGFSLFAAVDDIGKGDAKHAHLGDLRFARKGEKMVIRCPAVPRRIVPGVNYRGPTIRAGITSPAEIQSLLPVVPKDTGSAYVLGTLSYASDVEGILHCEDFAYAMQGHVEAMPVGGKVDLLPDDQFSSTDVDVLVGSLVRRLCGSDPDQDCNWDETQSAGFLATVRRWLYAVWTIVWAG